MKVPPKVEGSIEDPAKPKEEEISKSWVTLPSESRSPCSWKRTLCVGLTVALLGSLGFVSYKMDLFAKLTGDYQDPKLAEAQSALQTTEARFLELEKSLQAQKSESQKYLEIAKERTEAASNAMEEMQRLQEEHHQLANVALNQMQLNNQLQSNTPGSESQNMALNHKRFEIAVAKADEICKKQYSDRCKERYSLSHVRNLVETPLTTVDQWKAKRQAAFDKLPIKYHWFTAEELLEKKKVIKEIFDRQYPVDHLDFFKWNFRVYSVPTDGYRCDICRGVMHHGEAAYGNRVTSMDACADCCAKYQEGTARRLFYTHPLIQKFVMKRFGTFPASSCERGSSYVCDLCKENIEGEVFGEKREWMNDAILGPLHDINNEWTEETNGNISTLDCCQSCRAKHQGLHSTEGVIAELIHIASLEEMQALNKFEIEHLLHHFAGFYVTAKNWNEDLGGKIVKFRKAFFIGRDIHDENDIEDPSQTPELKGLGEMWVHVGDNEVHVEPHSHDASKRVGKRIFGRREYFVFRGLDENDKVLALAPNGTKGWVPKVGVDGNPILRKRSEILTEVQHQWAKFYKWFRQVRHEIHSDNDPMLTPLLGNLQYAIAEKKEGSASQESNCESSSSSESESGDADVLQSESVELLESLEVGSAEFESMRGAMCVQPTSPALALN